MKVNALATQTLDTACKLCTIEGCMRRCTKKTKFPSANTCITLTTGLYALNIFNYAQLPFGTLIYQYHPEQSQHQAPHHLQHLSTQAFVNVLIHFDIAHLSRPNLPANRAGWLLTASNNLVVRL